jgi:diguanylate cyclase (GGDEF)-like protein
MMAPLIEMVPGCLPRLVLVEDNLADARLVQEMLRFSGIDSFDVVHHVRVGDACQDLAEGGAACVLLDLSLPDAEGLEAVRRAQKAAPEVPIVVLSGREDEVLALAAVQEGAQDYLLKGSDGALIARAIKYAIERKRVEVELNHQAMHDPLTQLPNRNVFLDRLRLALARTRRQPGSVAVLFLDFDRFKVINDSLGHETGDRLLIETAHRLSSALRPSDTVARFGGDEFTILCEDIDGEIEACVIAQRVLDAIGAPFAMEDAEAHLSASLGIAISSAIARPEDMIRDADAAMYRAKDLGKSRYEIFDDLMRARALERMDLENAMYHAAERNELRVLYQPLMHLASGHLKGVEALVRWEHPERGLLGPGAFIGVAEETGRIVEIGAWVLREACRQAARWEALRGDADPLWLSVNLSARQLQDPGLVPMVKDVLAETGIDPASLCLEITESVMIADAAASQAALAGLKDTGARIGIDDFGTGYASLSFLKSFPADVLKVDRSFVAGIGNHHADGPIVAAVINLAQMLGLTTVAEGVETPDQYEAVRALGCGYGQGFLFAHPLPPEEIVALMDQDLRPSPAAA